MHTPKSLIISMLLLSLTQIIGMENPATLNNSEAPPFVMLPNELATIIIAQCEDKDVLRQTCKHFSQLASSKINKVILTCPQLNLTQRALDLLFLEYGALGEAVIVRNLLEKGAHPNTCDDHNMTVMHYAAEGGDVEVIKLLLNYSALIATDITEGKSSPYQLAVNNGHINVIKYLLEKEIIDADGLEENLIVAVAKKANNKKYHVNVNKKNENGLSPLQLASCSGNFYRTKMLLQHGADINEKDKSGMTPLHSASKRGHFHIVSLLLHQGVNVNEKCDGGGTPLHYACHGGYVEVVMLLLHNGAHVNEKTNSGNTSLYWACNKGYYDMVGILLRYGADINDPVKIDGRYVTPLSIARLCGHTKVAELLKKHGGIGSHKLPENKGCIIQ